jgi:hypothetical protein
LQAPVAHVTHAARDVEWNDDPVSLLQAGDAAAHLLDDAHRLVAKNVAFIQERPQDFIEVQVRTAQSTGRHPDDGIGWFLDRWIGNGIDAHVALAMPDECFHVGILSRGRRRTMYRKHRERNPAATVTMARMHG